jgi:hypothetical protein
MAENPLVRSRWLVWLVVAWGVATAAAPRLAEAAPLPPARSAGAAGDLEALAALLEQRIVRTRLASLGITEAELAALWRRLTPAERTELAARADEVRAGGDAAAAVAVAIIVAMLVILVLELLGRRVISRP